VDCIRVGVDFIPVEADFIPAVLIKALVAAEPTVSV
jgi:hypothetical protein